MPNWYDVDLDSWDDDQPNNFYKAGYARVVYGHTQEALIEEGMGKRVREWMMGFADALSDQGQDSSLIEAAIREHYGS